MKRHKILILCFIGILVLLLGTSLVFWFFIPASPIAEANLRNVKEGMTLKEVENILGSFTEEDPSATGLRRWIGDEIDVAIPFDEDGKAYKVWMIPHARRSLWQRISTRFGWK